MPKQESRFDTTIHFQVESELKDTIEKIASARGMNKSQVIRKLLRENLDDFIKNKEDQLSLTEDLQENGI